jgi:hypothetical protein
MVNLKMRADVWKNGDQGWAVTTYNPDNTRSSLATEYRPTRRSALNRAAEMMKLEIIDEVAVFNLSHVRIQRLFDLDDFK